VGSNILSNLLCQYFRAAARNRIEARSFKTNKGFFQRELADLTDVYQLNRRKGVPDNAVLPELLLDSAQEVLIPVQLQLGVTAALHQDFYPADIHHLLHLTVTLRYGQAVPFL